MQRKRIHINTVLSHSVESMWGVCGIKIFQQIESMHLEHFMQFPGKHF